MNINSTDIYADQLKALEESLDNTDIKNIEDAKTFVYDLTKVIYDYKNVGKMYDFYAKDVQYFKQNKIVFTDIDDVVHNVLEFLAAFPNVTTNIENIIAYKVDDDFYKVSKRLRYFGNNLGTGRFGKPTGKSLENKGLNMCILYLKRVEGKWKVTFEINNDSEAWIEEVQKNNNVMIEEVVL